MTEMSARARACVERARQGATPSAQDLSHLRAKLSASLAGQAPDPVLLPFSLGKLAGVLVVAAAGLGAWHMRGALAEHDRQASTVPVPAVARFVPAAAVTCPPAPSCAPPPAVVLPVKGVACAPTPATGAADAEDARGHRGMRHDLFSVEAASRDASLELELLMLSRVALDEDRSMDAVGHALRHEELYPKSAFEEERLAIQVLAWCSAGNRERAAQQFERLVKLSPQTTYLPRVRGTCGDDFVRASEDVEPEP